MENGDEWIEDVMNLDLSKIKCPERHACLFDGHNVIAGYQPSEKVLEGMRKEWIERHGGIMKESEKASWEAIDKINRRLK